MANPTLPPKSRHLQLVPSGVAGPPPLPGSPEADDDFVHGHLLAQVATENRLHLRGGWNLVFMLLAVLGTLAAGLHFGVTHWHQGAHSQVDVRRFSMLAFIHSRAEPDVSIPVTEHSTVRVDDAWTFVLHNRSRKNVWFGIFAVTPQGQFSWFYPHDGGGEDVKTLPLPAIPTITLPDGITPETLTPGTWQVYGLFTPAPVVLSQVEAAFAAHGGAALRESLQADVQVLCVTAILP